MNDIFISYAHPDRSTAQIVTRALEEHGWSVWWDPKIPPGKVSAEGVEEALDKAKCVVVLWSKNSAASDWVKTEATEGRKRNILVPVVIEDVNIPLEFRLIESARLIDWQGTLPDPEFDRLLRAIASTIDRSSKVQTSIQPEYEKKMNQDIQEPLYVEAYKQAKQQTFGLVWWACSAIVLFFSAVLISNQQALIKSTRFDFFVAVYNVVFISLFLFLRFTPYGAPAIEKGKWSKEVEDSFRQLLKGWTAIWITWLGLYMWLSIIFGTSNVGDRLTNSLAWSIADCFNIINSLAFFYSFLVLDMPSVPIISNPNRHRQFRIALLNANTLCGMVLILSILGRFGILWLSEGGPLLLSFLSGISMAYFFGRLDSHYIRIKRRMLAPLYLYVVIQVNWASFGETDYTATYRSIFFCLALLLKLYLFVVFTYWLHRGAIHRYLEAAGRWSDDKQS